MVNINLLPWRRIEQEWQQRGMKLRIGLMITIVLVIVISWYGWLSNQIDESDEKLQLLKHQISQLSPSQTVSDSVDDKWHEAQVYHFATRKLFATMGSYDGNDVCFESVFRRKNTITFIGKTRSVTDLTNFLRTWRAATLFSDVQIERLEKDAQAKMMFRLQANMLVSSNAI